MWYVEKMTGTVLYNNEIVGQLGSSEVALLSCMVEEPSRVFTKDELLDLGWPDRIVSPNSLTVAIKNIRKIFGYRPSQLNIKTKHGHGYALHLPVENEIAIVDEWPIVDEHTTSPQDVNNEDSVLVVDEQAPTTREYTDDLHIHHRAKNKKQKVIVLWLKLLAMTGLCFWLLSLDITVALYDKRVYCEKIDGVSFCGSRPLAYSERSRLVNGKIDIDRSVDKYVYGYNYTTQNMVFYPLR
ncbi:winged helix-turn-helix domain-containing protein [Aeromonas veronii]|uniref:winged helix-turn-helix domain-containing protein n=1 Tax=Aeromonas veronii TaxID=654 RepID=UPI0040555724